MEESQRTRMATILGLVFLVLSLAGSVLNIPSFLMLADQSIYLKVMWRHSVVLIFTLPPVVIQYFNDAEMFLALVSANWCLMFLQGLLQTVYVYLVYYAANKTFVSHSLIFSTLPLVYSSLWKIVRRFPLTRIDYIGLSMVFFGMFLCLCESNAIDSISLFFAVGKSMFIGDMCAIAASVVLAIHSSFTDKILRENLPYTNLTITSAVILVFSYLASIFAGNRVELLSFSPTSSLLGLLATWYFSPLW